MDVCAALTGSDYQRARNYWKWLKHKLKNQSGEPVSISNQLKFEASVGKLRFTDVMDAEEILRLIQIFPSPKADAFKLWIADPVNKDGNTEGQQSGPPVFLFDI